MKPVVRFIVSQAVFINVVFVILLVAGGFSVVNSPVENMPVVDIGEVYIHTLYYGASAEDVEQLVTIRLEEAIDGLEDVEFIQSSSYRNFSAIHVKFIDDSDYESLFDDLRLRILNIKNELPKEADDPSFLYANTHEWIPVIAVNLTGEIPRRSLKLYAEELKSRILEIPGVQTVRIEGEFEPEFHVSLDPEKLRKYGITFYEAVKAVESANTKIPTGRFRMGEKQFMLDAGKKPSSQRDVLSVVVRKDGDGNFIRVRDLVTNVRLHHRDPSLIHTVNGTDSLRLWVQKTESGNALTISGAVKKISTDYADSKKTEGIRVVFTLDSTYEINDSVKTLGGNLELGMTLVLIVLMITLGFRNALLAAVGIPFSFLCAILIMYLTGVSINTISLFSFVLVTGIIVDDAVIIVENVYRHMQLGKTHKQAVIDGTSEVMLPVISAALTTVFAFLPMLIMTGSTGEFFSYVPKTVTYALIASIIEALFILPIHILDWGPKKVKNKVPDETQDPFFHLRKGLFAPVWKVYHFILQRFLNHKILSLSGVTLLFLAAVFILVVSVTGKIPLIKVQFFPGNYFRYHVAVQMPIGTSLEKTDALIRQLSEYIMSFGTQQAQSAAGSAGFYEDIDYRRYMGDHYGQIVITLPEDKDRNFPENPDNDPMQHLAFIRSKLDEFVKNRYPDAKTRPIVHVFKENDGPPTGKPVSIRVTALKMENAVGAADMILDFMKTQPELSPLIELKDDRPDLQKIVQYTPKMEAVYEYGLDPAMVVAVVAGALNGWYAGQYRSFDEEVDLLVRMARTDDQVNMEKRGIADPTDILNIPVIEHSSSPVRLRDLVDIEYTTEPHVINRYKAKPCVTISSDIKSGSNLSSPRVQKLVSDFFDENQSGFQGVSLSFAGEFEATGRSYKSLTIAFFIAVMAIYMVLASQFNSYIQPLIIITAVPFALIGVVMGLFFSQTTFTIGSFMAIVGLAGIAVNNSLLLIDFMNKRKDDGKPVRDAVIEACAARMRPVLITTVTTMLGLLPMAIGIPRKSISWAPMATAFVAGLTSATILALLLIPVEYEFFEQMKTRTQKCKEWFTERRKKWKNRSSGA